jgi:hypothetical protein
MESGSNTATTSDKTWKTERGTEISEGDYLFWYENYRNLWDGGRVFENEFGMYGIYGTGWSMSEFSWAVAEGRIKSNHIFVLNKTDLFKSHEVQHIIRKRE